MKSVKNFFYFCVVIGLILSAHGLNARNLTPEDMNNNSNNNKSGKSVTAGCTQASGRTYLELNNVRALLFTGGDMWWDMPGGNAKYEVPKGSGKTALFAGCIWIGGVDVNGQLKIAAQRFRQNGVDYWTGPLITSGDAQATVTPDICRDYDKHFVITRNEVINFRSWFRADAATKAKDFKGYNIPSIITNWPAHGPDGGYDYHLAPFFDNNDDDYYDPQAGDYPYYDIDGREVCGTSRELRKVRLYGDQTLWWVYNDKGNLHTESGGDAIGMELRAQAFAFSTNDELNNMTFYNYEIINRSTYTLTNAYFGVWTDADLGYADDDFVGCDVNKGLGYLYNGKDVDGTGQAWAYGVQPPAIGIDFFEGPYQDGNGVDDLSSWPLDATLPDCQNGYGRRNGSGQPDPAASYTLAGSGDIINGNINGLNFGDGIVDNERWGMRRFIYFNREGNPNKTDPGLPTHYYNYLLGKWKNNANLCYGGTGFPGEPGTSTVRTDFMFPYDSDPCGWGQGGQFKPPWSEAGNAAGDRRIVQSAGPFTLYPGMVNDITTGAVWARATKGGPWQSVEEVRRADNKAQKLFESCFKVLDGPDGPDMTIIELDKEFIFHISNKSSSNNYLERYHGKDPYIPSSRIILNPDSSTTTEYFYQYFDFEGYQVFQLKDADVSIAEIKDADKARLVFQCDIKNDTSQLVNYEWFEDLNANIATEEVNGNDSGIVHSFRITEDLFASGSKRLVNHKKYYYIAIAYAINDYLHYNQTDPNALDGQKMPYKAGRKGADGPIKVYDATPHKSDYLNGGTILNAKYGDELAVTQYDGHGNANNSLELYDESLNQIMSGPPWKANTLKYKPGHGPITVKVVDPLNVPKGEYVIRMCPDSLNTKENYVIKYFSQVFNYDYNFQTGFIISTKWYATDKPGVDNGSDTIGRLNSDAWISTGYEQIIPQLGVSVTIDQGTFPLKKQTIWTPNQCPLVLPQPPNNGFINASIEFSNPDKAWLYFVPDLDEPGAFNWIKSGTYVNATDGGWPGGDDVKLTSPSTFADPDEIFEKVLVRDLPIPYYGVSATGGTWAPYRLCSYIEDGPANAGNFSLIKQFNQRISSVNIVITSDKSKWSRCPVIELCENAKKDYDSLGNITDLLIAGKPVNYYSQGNIVKFGLRDHKSIDKDGKTVDSGGSANSGENDCNYISPTGMGWFPGYAIDVETGERLNMMYGEDSHLPGENGQDMMWNPSPRIATDLYWATYGDTTAGKILFGGKHYIYVMGHNIEKKSVTGGIIPNTLMKRYDAGDTLRTLLDPAANKTKEAMMNAMWVALPILNPDYKLLDCDVTVKLRVTNPYERNIGSKMTFSDAEAPNENYPMYSFSTEGFATEKNNSTVAKEAMDFINVVPNPYYGYNNYEQSQLDNIIKITNLPQKCTISIYTVNGSLVRRKSKDNDDTFVDWDLKNTYGITVASGVYIIHIDVPDVGEKIIKWFGAMRPIDLNSF